MIRFTTFYAIIFVVVGSLNGLTNAFTVPSSSLAPKTTFLSRTTPLHLVDEPSSSSSETTEQQPPSPPPATSIDSVERGVSVDQDGKSNVWAIEPKVEVDSKSSEEKSEIAGIAIGGFLVFALFASIILNNLPDPDNF